MNTFTTSEALSFGWKTTKEHFGYLLGLLVLMFVSTYVLGLFSDIRVLGFLILVAGQTVLGIGFTRSIISLKRGQKLSYAVLFKTIKPFWRFLGATVLTMLIVGVGLIILIIPGIIFAVTLMFVKYLAVDTEKPIIEVLTESARITKGHRWQLLGFGLVVAVINVIGALLFGIGLLVTMPITHVAMAYVYDKLAAAPVVEEATAVTPMEPKEEKSVVETSI